MCGLQYLEHLGTVVAAHGSRAASLLACRTCIPGVGRQILIHCATGEVQCYLLNRKVVHILLKLFRNAFGDVF